MAQIDLHDAYRYCKERISMFSEKESIALERINEWRCPLYMADESLYYEMEDAMQDYCENHDFDYDELDVEEVFWADEE